MGQKMIEDDELVIALSFETNVVVELCEPVTAIRPLGKTGTVRMLRFYADDPRAAVAAIKRFSPASR
jgi:hypothetical protein